MRRLCAAALDRPRTVLLLCAVGVGLFALGLPQLRLATDGRSLFSPEDPGLVFQRQVDERFVSADLVILGIEATGPGGLWTPAALERVRRLSRTVSSVDGVAADQVRSLATVPVVESTPEGLRVEPPLAGPVRDRGAALVVRDRVRDDPLAAGVLVSHDEASAALYVPIAAGEDRRATFGRLRAAVDDEWARLDAEQGGAAGGHRLRVLGPVVTEALLGEHVLSDLALLLPVALAVVAVLLWVWFRSLAMVVAGLGEAAVVMVASLGLMGLVDRPLSLVTVVMPVILGTYCVADSIHIAQRYCDKRREHPDLGPRPAMEAALGEVMRPVAFTSLTTAAGFLAFAWSPIPAVADFGLFTAWGIFVALLLSLLAVPPTLLALGLEARAPRAPGRGLEALTRATLGRPATALAVGVAASALLALGLPRLVVQDSWIDNFDPRDELVRADTWFNDHFLGSNLLNLVAEGETPAAAYDPAFLASLDALGRRLEALPEVGGTRSLADALTVVGPVLDPELETPRLPVSLGEAQEWALLVDSGGGRIGLHPYVDATASTANLWVFLNQADYRRTRAVVEAASALPASAVPGPAGELRFAGDAFLGYRLVDAIARSLRSSLLVAFALVLGVAWWMLRSPVLAGLVTLPVAVAVLWNFGFMAWTGMAVGVATSTFSAIAFGIGIDFALHWIARLRIALEHEGWFEAAARAAGSAGSAILLQGVVAVCGFAVLLFSGIPPVRQLGLLMSVNLVACLLATLVLLPAVATLLRGRLPRHLAGASFPEPVRLT